MRRRLGTWASLPLALSLLLPSLGAASGAAAAPPPLGATAGVRLPVAARLLSSDPPVYAQDYAKAEAYLLGIVGTDGQASADPEAQAWIALALDDTAHGTAAGRADVALLGEQAADGSWGERAGATGVALWALAEHARLAGDPSFLARTGRRSTPAPASSPAARTRPPATSPTRPAVPPRRCPWARP